MLNHIPTLPAGTCQAQVTTQQSNGGPVKKSICLTPSQLARLPETPWSGWSQDLWQFWRFQRWNNGPIRTATLQE